MTMSEHLDTVNKLSGMVAALSTEIIDTFTDPLPLILLGKRNTEPQMNAYGDVSSGNANENTLPAGSRRPRRRVNHVPTIQPIVSFKRQVARANFNVFKAANITLKLESAIIEKETVRFGRKLTDAQNALLDLQILKLKQILKKQRQHFADLQELHELLNTPKNNN